MNEASYDTLQECASLYKVCEQNKYKLTEITMLNKNSAESLFDKIQDNNQRSRVESERKVNEMQNPFADTYNCFVKRSNEMNRK